MNPLRRLFSLLIISTVISVCSASEVHRSGTGCCTSDEQSRGIGRFAPLGTLEGSLLFKAAITVMGDYYSGLVLIKQMPADGAIHVVFLSELGLNLMDLAYLDDEFEVVSVQEFLNRRSILKTLQNDFRTLLLDLSEIEDFSVNSLNDGVTEKLKFRHKSQRYSYSCHKSSGPAAIRRKKGLIGRVDFQIRNGANAEPLTIGIRHRGVRLKIDLTELNQL
ncbi:MAG: hypothetical protein GY790_07875 [Bacteroidetes bacterium]|nr:hypothetical protein [Bacteroidota bacterium]